MRVFFNSIRFRIAATYSLTIFSIVAIAISTIYWLLSRSLGDEAQFLGQPISLLPPRGQLEDDLFIARLEQIEELANEQALETLRDYSLITLGVLFMISMIVGWVVAGRTLKPIKKISAVAQEIQRSQDFTQRINQKGTEDELKKLADVFDEMLLSLESAFNQRVEALEANRKFIRESSHEIRNPMQIIRSNLQIALNNPNITLEECRETMEVVTKAIDRMSKVINGLMQSDSYTIVKTGDNILDLSLLVNELEAEFSKPILAKGIELKTDINDAKIKGDSVAIKQAVENLLINAIEALESSPNGVKATKDPYIYLRTELKNGIASLSVEDNGPGVQPEDRARIFERNVRARGKAQVGRGIGLTIVRQVAEAHGGKVEVNSHPGQKTVFSVIFPSIPESSSNSLK